MKTPHFTLVPAGIATLIPRLSRILRLSSIARLGGLTVLTVLCACQTTSSFNNTAYPYVFEEERLQQHAVKTLLIAPVNLGPPSKKYLHKHRATIDKKVAQRLGAAGYHIADPQLFQQAWRIATRKYGQPYHPLTTQLNANTMRHVMHSTLSHLRQNSAVDAVLFSDLIERQITFGSHGKRSAKWDGVTRKPRLKGGTSSVSQGFDWSQTVPAISLSLTLYRNDGRRLFHSVGGLEVSRQIDARRGNGRFVRRDKILRSQNHIREGIALALHPLVPMEDYPQP